MGAQEDHQPAEPGNISLVTGDQRVRVTILKNDAVIHRNRILETILTLTAHRGAFSLVYLAAPRLLGTAIDAGLFRSFGIGLIIFDERRIEEVVAPQPIQVPPTQEPAPHPADDAVATELATLKSMYAELERSITMLREELKASQKIPNQSAMTKPMNRSPLPPPSPIFGGQGLQLPSFFSNNPWLDVLSKRGRFEDDQIAA